ncbi:MAG: antibiotic biosynthesis monooxygenase [Actinomycetia bacterium]|nr:antibiotic biosynthesis monooxygenase [Actinomycetes bacterium]
MTVTRFARFHVDPSGADEMLSRRAALVDGIRQRFPGLIEARLTRVDERTWVDVWRWESRADLQRALAGGPTVAEAPAVFALTEDLSTEDADDVDQR